MKNRHVIELLPDYLDDILEDERKTEVDVHLEHCSKCSNELAEMHKLFNAFKNDVLIAPSKTVRANFYAKLVLEHKESVRDDGKRTRNYCRHRKLWSLLKVAAGFALLVSSFLLGKYQNYSNEGAAVSLSLQDRETSKTKIMLGLLGDISASRRIQGVNYIDGLENPDEIVLDALIERMFFDQNSNVRLSAVDALTRFTEIEKVRNSLVLALRSEKDPLIQIGIIKRLVKIQEQTAIAPMRYLLEQKDTQPFVKEQLKVSIPSIL